MCCSLVAVAPEGKGCEEAQSLLALQRQRWHSSCFVGGGARARSAARGSSRRLSIRASSCGSNIPSLASVAYTQLARDLLTDQGKSSAIWRSQIVEWGIRPERHTRHQGSGLGLGGLHLVQLLHRSRAAARQPCDETRMRGSKRPLKRRHEEPIRGQRALFAGEGSAAGGQWWFKGMFEAEEAW